MLKTKRKLPSNIGIDFRKSGKYIVATIHSGFAFKNGRLSGYKDKFMTQGRTEKEVVEMISDAISVYYNL